MKRGILVLLGVILLLLGLALIAGGASVAALVGSDDSLSTAPAHLSGQGVALVAEDITIDESNLPVPSSVGTLTLSVTSPRGGQMFAGTASAADVDRYLTGAPYDVVVDMSSGSTATTRPVPGGQQPKAPASQTFWTSQASGTTATLASAISPTTTVVIMNADASKQVDADVVVTFTVKHVYTGAIVAAGVGVLLLVLAIVSFWRARVAGRRKREAAAAASSATVGAAQGAAVGTAAGAATVLPGATAVSSDSAAAVAAGDASVQPDVPPDAPPLATTPIPDTSFAAPGAAPQPALTPPAATLSPPDPVTVAATAFAATLGTGAAVDGHPPVADADAVSATEPGVVDGTVSADPGATPPDDSVSTADAPVAVDASPGESAPVVVPASLAVDAVEGAGGDDVAVPAWAVSGGPDTLTGDELAAPPHGDVAVTGGFADDAAQAAAVAGDTGAIAPVVVPAPDETGTGGAELESPGTSHGTDRTDSTGSTGAEAEATGTASAVPTPVTAAQPDTEPEPSEPALSEPVPSEPVPSEPVPSEPVPSEPVPSEPVPSEPVPSEPVPSEPVPSEPVPSTAPAAPVDASSVGHDTEPFERVDAPLYDELAGWFRDDAPGGTTHEH